MPLDKKTSYTTGSSYQNICGIKNHYQSNAFVLAWNSEWQKMFNGKLKNFRIIY
jgi:hypothetical protein